MKKREPFHPGGAVLLDLIISFMWGAVAWSATGSWQAGLGIALSVFLFIDWLRRY